MFKISGLLIFLSLIFVSFLTVALSSYIVKDYEIASINNIGIVDESDSLKRVTFSANPSLGISEKIMYVEQGKTISLIDAPKYSSSNGYIERSDGTNKLSIKEGFDKTLTINNNVVLSSTNITSYDSISSNELINFNGSYNGKAFKKTQVNTDTEGVINLEENGTEDKTDVVNFGEFKKGINVVNDVDINMYFNHGGSQHITLNGLGKGDTTDVNGDTTIGIQDPSSAKSDYKPQSGGTNNKNYCVNRINLTNDLLLVNSNLNVGAWIGFYCGSTTSTYYQLNAQGFIIGQYSEIDLCGHYLIIGSNTKLWLAGSITNSDPSGKGGLIIENDGTMEASIVMEDHHHEESIPSTYTSGDSTFSMYRAPYLNCTSYFMNGANIQYAVNVFFGPSQGAVYTVIVLMGDVPTDKNLPNDLKPVIDITKSKNGYVKRTLYYDDDIKNNISTSYEINNMLSQKIEYKIYNLDFDIYLPVIKANIGAEFNINMGKNNFYVSPYYSFYLFNSKCTLYNQLVFMPGSYLFVDDNSKIIFSYKEVKKSSDIKSGESIFAIKLMDGTYYQEVAGLTFIIEKYDYKEAANYYIDDNDEIGKNNDNGSYASTRGSNALIFRDAPNYRSYLNKNKNAKCDYNGTIEFVSQNNISRYRTYTLAGNINFKNYKKIYESCSSVANIEFYSHNFKSAASKFNSGIYVTSAIRRLNISDFYCLPLISNGVVVTNPENPKTLLSDFSNLENKYVYDKTSGLVKNISNNKFYAFLFLNESNSLNVSVRYLNKCGYSKQSDFQNANKVDDLEGKYVRVNYHSNFVNSYDGSFSGNYVFFRGMFVSANINGNEGTADLRKFRATETPGLAPWLDENDFFNGSMNGRKISYMYSDYNGYNCWRLV